MSREGRDWADLQSALPSKGRVLAWHLGYFADDKGVCYGLPQAKLVQRTGWAKGTLKWWTDLLRALDLVATRRRFNPRKQHHDALIYKLNLGRVVTAEEVKEALSRIAILRSHSTEPDRKNRGSRIATGGTLMKNPKKDVLKNGADAAGAPPARRPAASQQSGSEIITGAAREPELEHEARARTRDRGAPAPAPKTMSMSAAVDGGAPAAGAAGPDHEARQAHEPAAPKPPSIRRMPMIDQPPRDPQEVIAEYQLLAKVEAWAESGRWDVAADGPPPFAPGCRVLAELLPKTIRVARKGPAPQPVTVGELMAGLSDAMARRAA